MQEIFVYGTLKRGSPRSIEDMYPGSHFIKKMVVKGFTLYKQPFRNFPVMVQRHPWDSVEGEVYLVSNKTLAILDKREGVATGWYSREYFVNTDIHVYMWKHITWFFKHIGRNFKHI